MQPPPPSLKMHFFKDVKYTFQVSLHLQWNIEHIQIKQAKKESWKYCTYKGVSMHEENYLDKK